MKVTVKSIAERCKVGRSTVSFILAGKSSQVGISDKLTAEVQAVAKEMGYKSNALAAAVRSGKSKTIAILASGFGASYIMRTIDGINHTCDENGYNIKLLSFNNQEDIEKNVDKLVGQMIAGVIIAERLLGYKDIIGLLKRHNIKLVNAFNGDEREGKYVFSDDYEGSRMAVDKLFNLGHRNIARCQKQNVEKYRKEGFLSRIHELKLNYKDNKNLILSENHSWNTADLLKVKEFMMHPDRPSAIFCEADPVALRFMQYAQNLGYRIPEDISVMGYADVFYARMASPALSTIAQPFFEIGAKAAEVLISDIENRYSGEDEILLPVNYIERMSTKNI